MNQFEKNINDYSQSWSQFCQCVKEYYKLYQSRQQVVEGEDIDQEKRAEFYRLQKKIYDHVTLCNSIAEKIGFQSLTKNFDFMGQPYDWLIIVLSQEEK
mgnify:CR=1 FL=1|tara:strand:+ start:6026 stop:6322 length:297 start_codon:yes stop_codon:yes gene_type:complete